MIGYSRLLIRHHWLVLGFVVLISIILTIVGLTFTQLPDFSDPRIGWGARGKGTIFSQLMVLRHASERFRLAYELPLETYELFGAFNQFSNVTVDDLDEDSYKFDVLAKHDLWRKKNPTKAYDELIDYNSLNDNFYEHDVDDNDMPDYDEQDSQSSLLYQWHRDRHFDLHNSIIKYVDDKMINVTVSDFVKSLPQFNRSNYQSARLPFDLFRPYAYLLEEKYRGRTGRDGMIEFYIERTEPSDDLLSLEHLQSICEWEHKFKELLLLDDAPSLSLATFVALYSSKTSCHLITQADVENFRSILHTCLPYYLNGYMDIPLSDIFLNRVILEHQPGHFSHQEQVKAVYTALRHTCFYKNITRFIFDHFVDKKFIVDFQQSKYHSNVALSMIYISNYKSVKYNHTRDQVMCLRRQPYSRMYCEERGCMNDFKNNYLHKPCANQGFTINDCYQYCQCKYQCPNETEQIVLMTPTHKGQELVDYFEKYFSGKRQLPTYRDKFIKLVALNFANIRERAAMSRISEDMLLVLIAAALIVGITVLYLRSVSIALVIVVGAALSVGVSYFIYRAIYRIPIFPFMNLMSAFILIGIGCDDIFVFFDTWDQEKVEWLRKYQERQQMDTNIPLNELNEEKKTKRNKLRIPSNAFQARHKLLLFNDPEEMRKLLLSENALTEIMAQTLKHAASSMFVTSFTTSAAFFTNMLTNISFVQVFGVFTGTCILLYFVITVTAIAAFAVIYERYIQTLASRLFSTRLTNVVDASPSSSSAKLCRRLASICRDIRNYIFGYFMPLIIINLRFVLVLLFLPMGILGLVGVFHYPKLQVPSTQKVAFFLKDNPMEIYEFSMKNNFNGYSKEEKRLFAYPSVSFIFGIRDIDDGYIFDMNDRGHLHLTPIYLERQMTLKFFKDFISHLGTRADLFGSNYDLEKDFETFYQLSTDDILIAKIIDDRVKQNLSFTNHTSMIKYLRNNNVNLVRSLIRETVRTVNYTVEDDPSDMEDYINKKSNKIDVTLNKISRKQLINTTNPIIIYSNYRKLFNKTLEKYYKEQIKRSFDQNEIRRSLNETIRDRLTEEYHRSALKTAMQCLTGVAGANNVPEDFCERQLKKQRSINWAVLPDKPSPVDGSVRPFAVIITIRDEFYWTELIRALNNTDYDSYNTYYFKVKNFFDPYIKQHAPKHLQHAWFSSPGFAFYGVQRELLVGSYSSLIASLGIALLVLFLTSGNLFIALYALITISFAIAVSVAIFAALKWELGIVEAIIVIMSVGLSVDFVVHFGVGYIHADSSDINREREKIKEEYLLSTANESSNNNEIKPSKMSTYRLLYKQHQSERETRVTESISRVGSAVFMAAFTTFAAGFSMTLSSLTSFRQMGQFLMTIMFTSWMFSMFFFLPLCAIMGPVGKCGSIPFARIGEYLKQCLLFRCHRRRHTTSETITA